MEKETKSNIEIISSPMSNAGPSGTFIFSTLSFLFWAGNIGLFNEGGGIAIGMIQLGVFGAYVVVSTTLLSRGDSFAGNTFLVFCAVFGGVGGLTNVFSALAAAWNIPFDNTAVGIPFITSGLFLLLVLPGLKYAPKTDFLIYLLGGLGVTASGLVTMGVLPASLCPVIGWTLFGVGVVAFYSFIAAMLAFLDVIIPVGKPFFKQN